MRAKALALLALTVLSAVPAAALAQAAGPTLPLVVGQGSGGTSYSVPVQTLLFFTALSFLPAVLLMMTGFTRIVIVLSLLRQALGSQAAPPNQLIVGLSLFLTFFVMGPTIDRVYAEAYQPYAESKIPFDEALRRGEKPMREFMLRQTRQSDVMLFSRLAKIDPATPAAEVPFKVLVPAFVTSELKSLEDAPLIETKVACLLKAVHKCGKCIEVCPVSALREKDFDRQGCWKRLKENRSTLEGFFDLPESTDVCGKCAALMPCSFKNPVASMT